MKNIKYMSGFGNYFESEAETGALIKGRNSPQKVPFGLYAEQLSGSAFTSPRAQNLRSWLYRIRPSVTHGEFKLAHANWAAPAKITAPTQMRWDPLPYPTKQTDFISGLIKFVENINAAIYLYAINASMDKQFFYNADGELLIVPQEGALRCVTEFGILDVHPTEIVVIPRGIKFQINLLEEKARGYVCENLGRSLQLPDLGLIGANGLANPRDFLIPTAAYQNENQFAILFVKAQHHLWQTELAASPLDVVAWHGNYVPYKYDLLKFNAFNSVTYDHADPSIFTVLTSPSSHPGTASLDFVIFPPRWVVSADTFRPPYFHRNVMSEFMGLIQGQYDAKSEGFVPGGSSLHNCMSAHGPDAQTYEQAITKPSTPEYYGQTLAFMFESRDCWNLSEFALTSDLKQKNYLSCWASLRPNFKLPEQA